MGRNELDAAGFEDTQPSQVAELSELTSPDDSVDLAKVNEAEKISLPTAKAFLPLPLGDDLRHRDDQAKEQATMVLSRLRAGQWVDLYTKRQWLRAQLIWASSHATLFMFISHGGQPHSMTKRSCEKLIAQRLLRPVDTQGVVAQALDAVTDAAAAQSRAAKVNTPTSQNQSETV